MNADIDYAELARKVQDGEMACGIARNGGGFISHLSRT